MRDIELLPSDEVDIEESAVEEEARSADEGSSHFSDVTKKPIAKTPAPAKTHEPKNDLKLPSENGENGTGKKKGVQAKLF